MPISLQKGQKVSLTKGNPGLTKVVVGLGWTRAPAGGSVRCGARGRGVRSVYQKGGL